MASLPPRQTRRTSPQRNSSSASSQGASQQKESSNSETTAATSEDSQTIILNRSNVDEQSSSANKVESQEEQGQEQEPRKCWICFNDETEDTPTTSEWRAPCNCALTAHETCLLDWVADLEAPSSRRTAGAPAKVQCPQCKYDIELSRPRSFVVDGVRLLERLSSRMVIPGVLFASGYTIYQGFFMHGVSTIYAVFGHEDAYRILAPLYENPDQGHPLPFIIALNKAFKHFRLCSGLALIPPALVLSRSTIGDSILPILPMVFLATSPRSDALVLDLQRWPPSAAISFAVLPYIRAAYNAYYERLWVPMERKWLREIQPRAQENNAEEQGGEGGEAQNDRNDDDDDGGGMLDVHIDVDINLWDDGEGGDSSDDEVQDAQPAQRRRRRNNDNDDNNNNNHAAPEAAPGEAGNAQVADAAPAPNRPALHEARQPNVVLSVWRTSQSILGALLFPTVAATMGSALRYVLPRAWTTPAGRSGRPAGLLQARWGRTLVGGCLFVAFRDAVLLYVRWKMAQGHKQRRVLDHPSKRKAPQRRFSFV